MAVAYRDLVRAIARRDDNRKMQAVAMEFLLTGGSRTHDAALEMAASSEARNGR